MNQKLVKELSSVCVMLKTYLPTVEGNYTVIVNGVPFPKYSYAVACALYSVARKNSANVALISSEKLIRRTWN